MPTQEEQLVMAGDEAEALLKSSAFTSAVDEVVETAFASFVNSAPEDDDKRTKAYHHYRAIADVVNTLKQRVDVRDAIIAQGDNSQEELGL